MCLNIYDKPESSNGGVFKIYDEPHRSGVFKVYDSRKACLKIYDEPASPNRGAESPNEGRV